MTITADRWTQEEMATKMNMIHHVDCLEFMKKVPDDYFDLVLTDPPYGIGASKFLNRKNYSADGKEYGRGNSATSKTPYAIKEWDNQTPSREVFNEIFRVSKKVIIFGGNYFVDKISPSPSWIFWDKNNGENNFSDGELAYTNFGGALRKYNYTWNGMIQQDMANKEERHHPTQKPTELFKMILRDYAVKNNYTKIFDAFIGSGTTAIASKSLGLDWCGCELEADYVEIANKRLEKVQGSLL